MGLDSVERVMDFEKAFGLKIPDEDAARLQTPRMVRDYAAARLPVVRAEGCVTQRPSPRSAALRACGVTAELRPGTPLRTLSDRAQWPVLWTRVRIRAGEPYWPASMPWAHMGAAAAHAEQPGMRDRRGGSGAAARRLDALARRVRHPAVVR